jgi:low temperature requirement protein LtrA
MAEAVSAPKRVNRPLLRTIDANSPERHASWLELFFDLVFVLAVSRVAMILAQSTDWYGFAKYAALFVPLWWTWIGFTFYADRFESEESSYRLLMFAAMLGVAALSLSLGSAFTPAGDVAFAICWSFVLLILAALYIRAAVYIPLARTYAFQFAFGLGLTVVILLGSLLTAPPIRYYIWAAALILDLIIPFFNRRVTNSIPVDFLHIPERLGLFTIIVLGEAVLATATGLSNVEWNITTISTAALGFGMASCIWWINFEFVEDSPVRSRSLMTRFIYLYGHFFIVASIVTFGIGVEHSIKDSTEHHLHLSTLTLLGGGSGVMIGAITVVRLIAGACRLIYVRGVMVAFILSLIYLGQFLPPLAVIGIYFALFFIGVWLEGRYGDVVEHQDLPTLFPCDHADMAKVFHPRSSAGCEECIKNNYKWVHLRVCLTCGHVGCCDSSVNRHATKHFHKEQHPLMASLEEGEHWSWCYVDERFVPLAHRIGKPKPEHLELAETKGA